MTRMLVMRDRGGELQRRPGPPPLVTGALSPQAELVHSGQQRGLRYEVYYDPAPETASRRQGQDIRGKHPMGWRRGLNYAAVVYTPYESESGVAGVEAEQIGFGRDIKDASEIASDYITRLYRHEQRHERREAQRGHPATRELDERREPQPVTDPDYIIQGLYNDGSISRSFEEFGFNNELVTIGEAKKIANASWFEGDYVRVITRDGELVWDSRSGRKAQWQPAERGRRARRR